MFPLSFNPFHQFINRRYNNYEEKSQTTNFHFDVSPIKRVSASSSTQFSSNNHFNSFSDGIDPYEPYFNEGRDHAPCPSNFNNNKCSSNDPPIDFDDDDSDNSFQKLIRKVEYIPTNKWTDLINDNNNTAPYPTNSNNKRNEYHSPPKSINHHDSSDNIFQQCDDNDSVDTFSRLFQTNNFIPPTNPTDTSSIRKETTTADKNEPEFLKEINFKNYSYNRKETKLSIKNIYGHVIMYVKNHVHQLNVREE